MRAAIAFVMLAAAGCAGAKVYLPNEPGGTLVDLRALTEREAWIAAHPQEPEAIRSAILEGVFVIGMTPEHVEVLRNPERAGVHGRGFWRQFRSGEEMRYRWFVGGEREPFEDGRGRPVCELVLAEGVVQTVRFCPGADPAAPAAEDEGTG